MTNSVNFYEFIGFVSFNITVLELIFVYTSFLLGRILVSMVPRATVHILGLKAKTPKKQKSLKKLKSLNI